MVIGLLVVANLAWFALPLAGHEHGSRDRPDSVSQVYPSEDSVIRPQDTIGFDLRDDLHGALEIDTQRIPEDQYTGDKGVGQVFWRPGDGQAFKELPEGRHDARRLGESWKDFGRAGTQPFGNRVGHRQWLRGR